MLRMLRTRFYIILSVLMSVLPLSGASQPVSPYDAVNPFIGTGNEGNCYPGAQAPFGMISISPNNPFDKKKMWPPARGTSIPALKSTASE